jgi:hypothetical protein
MRTLFTGGVLLVSAMASTLNAQVIVFPETCVLLPPPPISASTRGLALGDANITGREDDVIFYNPARLAIARGTSVAGERFDDQTASGTMATVARLGSGGVGFGAHVTAAQEHHCNAFGYPPLPPSVSETVVLGTVGFGQTIKRFQLGGAIKYLASQASVDKSRLAVDVGVARDMSIGIVPVSFGLAVQNLSSDAKWNQAPWRVALGGSAGGPVGAFDLAIAGQLVATNENWVLPAGGIELGYQWLDGYSISLRGGARAGEVTPNKGHFTGGAGLVLDRLSIDYAFETQIYALPVAHRIGLRIR